VLSVTVVARVVGRIGFNIREVVSVNVVSVNVVSVVVVRVVRVRFVQIIVRRETQQGKAEPVAAVILAGHRLSAFTRPACGRG
jgi:hypothetical protein